MSLQTSNVSGRMSGDILEKVYDKADEKTVDKEVFDKELFVLANQGRIRRAAHVFMFSLLGVLVSVAASYTFENKIKAFITVLTITLFYPFVDEVVQIPVPGRTFEWEDLCRDLLGSLIGILFVYLIIGVIRLIKKK